MEGESMNGETQVEQVRQEVMPIPDQAKMIIVKDQSTLSRANDFFLTIKALRKKIADTFNPIIQKAHEAHKEALNQKALIEAPLIVAETYLNQQVTTYKREQDRLRADKEERNRLEALRNEAIRRLAKENERIAQAAILEASGATEEAEALISEAIEEKEKPIEVYTPPPETPKVKLEGARITEYWSADVHDLRALVNEVAAGRQPLAVIDPIDTKKQYWPTLNALAKRLMKELNIPGVRAISRSSMSATGRR